MRDGKPRGDSTVPALQAPRSSLAPSLQPQRCDCPGAGVGPRATRGRFHSLANEELMSALRAVVIPGLLALVVAVAGCSDNGVQPTANDTSDQTAIAGTLAAVPDLLS